MKREREIIELKNTMEIKNSLYGFSSSMETEDRISELEDRTIDFTQSEQRENRLGEKKNRLKDLWKNN